MSLGDSYTKRGPGRTHQGEVMPAGTKLIKRFIRQATGENTSYRRDLEDIRAAMAAKQLNAKRSNRVRGESVSFPQLQRLARLLRTGRSARLFGGSS